jgi:hypothetical protein
MSKPFDPQLKKKNLPHLKLVVSNSTLIQKKPLYHLRDPNAGFTADVRKRGEFHFVLVASDPFHALDCEIPLEIRDDEELLDTYESKARVVVCHFPNILTEQLNEFIEEDEALHGMIMVQFQMKILEQLLLFSSDHEASSLFIHTDNTAEGHALGIYRKSAAYEDKIPTLTGTKTQLVIPITLETFDKLIDLSEHVYQDFRQILWENQASNPAIREYLKSNPCLKHFG